MVSKKGSAMIMMLLLITSITIMAITVLKSTIAFYDLALERMEFLRQHTALEALLLYGIGVGRMMHQRDQEQTHEFDAWPPPDGRYQGRVISLVTDKELQVMATLYKDKKIIDKTTVTI